MKKMNVLHDYLCSRMIVEGKKLESQEYGQIYYKTNEDLVDAYLDTDFRDKDVFSVLSSSDQVLTARYLDAKTVDAFDRNRLTPYYFYLRLWALKYNNELYPEIMNRGAHKWMSELLKKVKPESEEEKKALLFFQKHQQLYSNYSKLFFDEIGNMNAATLFQKAKDLEDCLSTELEFRCVDFFQTFEVEKDYDIVLMSNIPDLAKEKELRAIAENLRRLTRKNGTIICSNLIYQTPEKRKLQEEIFSPYFEREDKPYSYVYHRK